MLILADEYKPMRTLRREIFNNNLNHRFSANGNKRFGGFVSGFGKTAASSGHGNNDIKHYEVFLVDI